MSPSTHDVPVPFGSPSASPVHALRSTLAAVDAMSVSTLVILTGRHVAMLPLNRLGCPSIVHQLDPNDLRNSGLGAVQGAVVFADGNGLFSVDANGTCTPLFDASVLLGRHCEVNWELAADRTLGTIQLTDFLPIEASNQLRVVSVDLARSSASELVIDYPDSAAYQLDPSVGRVVWLRTAPSGHQDLVVTAPQRSETTHPLLHRYHWLRLARSYHQVLLSPAEEPGPISIVSLAGVSGEQVLPVQGHAAGWLGADHIAYHAADGSLAKYSIRSGQAEPLLTLAPDRKRVPGSFQPPTGNDDGSLLAWPWMARTPAGTQASGVVILNLREDSYRLIDGAWRRMAFVQ